MVLHRHPQDMPRPDAADAGPAASARPRIDLEREADLERCGALKDFWYVACLSSELGRKRPLGRTIFGLPIALFRDERGRAVAVRDRCLHRAAALSEGVVVDGRLCCPYHGWTYDGAGRCVHVPSLGPTQRGSLLSDVEHRRAGLSLAPGDVGCVRTFPTREQDGLVYVFLGAFGEDGKDRAPLQEPFPIPFFHHPGWVVYYMVTRFPNGVTNLVENFMDVPHTVFVHKGWFRDVRRKRVPATVERTNGSVLVTYRQEQDRLSGMGFVMNPFGIEPMVHTDKFYAPNVTRVDYTWGDRSGFVITSQCTPVGPTDSIVYTAISYRLPWDLPGSFLAKRLERVLFWYTTQVITQDVDIMAAQKKGMTNGAVGRREPLHFSSTEADLLHADIEAYRAWLLEGGLGDGPSDAVRDIVFHI
jgi:phenylpropionate dioxygenase-like ring-hydroxylating dioxygenase large terminal subunit